MQIILFSMDNNSNKLQDLILSELKLVKATLNAQDLEAKRVHEQNRRILEAQDNEIRNLKRTIENSGKYTIKQIVGALAIIIPILGFLKDIIRIKLMG